MLCMGTIQHDADPFTLMQQQCRGSETPPINHNTNESDDSDGPAISVKTVAGRIASAVRDSAAAKAAD